MNIGFTRKAQNALNRALYTASEMGHTCVGSEHLLLGLLSETDSIAERVLAERGVTYDKTKKILSDNIGIGARTNLSASDITPRTKRIIESSASIAVGMGHGYIGTEHMLLALIEEKECFAVRLITEQGAQAADIKRDVMSYFGSSEGNDKQNAKKKADEGLGDASNLSQFGRNLCKMAKEGKIDPIIGRDNETNRVIQILSRRTKNNPCLIGEPGVGKTAVVEGLAQRIVDGNIPDTLRDKIIVTLDISGMIAGAKYRGEFEERMKNVMDEVRRNPRIILFIDEIHTIIGAGGAEGAVDAANIIKPALARGEMQVIGATTINEYRRHIEKDAALERRFQSVLVGEPTSEEAEKILFGLRDKYEAHHKLKISDDAIRAAVKLSVRYISDRYLPDKAIDLIDEAASKKRILSFTPTADVRDLEAKLKAVTAEKEEAILGEDYEEAARLRDEEKKLHDELATKKENGEAHSSDTLVIDESDIADIVTSWTGIPVKKLADEESERLVNLDAILKEKIIGQNEAVESIARAIRRGRMGLKDPSRPIGSFIFLGPTGVGKTELSKVLADVMFGTRDSIIRVDMSEYMEKHSVSKLIGSPPGYVGYDEGGQLTEKVRRRPYSVVLFDEFEKANSDVCNMLLQILDDGRLTDGQGRVIDFRNTTIICTANLGFDFAREGHTLGFATETSETSYDVLREKLLGEAKRAFRPELLNRFDETVVFRKLEKADMGKILRLELAKLAERLKAMHISVTLDRKAADFLVEKGTDSVLGARPLRRVLQDYVEDPLADLVLAGKARPRMRIHLAKDGKSLKF